MTIAEKVQSMKESVEAVAGDTPFDIIYCIPRIEAVFFDGVIDLQRVFPEFKHVFIPELAKTNPKRQLDALLEQGGGPGNLGTFLQQLTSKEVKRVQSKDPLRQVSTFITKHRDPAMHSN
jgi:hypothetical protein